MIGLALIFMILNDKNIRNFLLNKLNKSRAYFVKEELRVIDNRAIADIVTLGKTIHGYEIKGETDSLTRLGHQIAFYDGVFDKNTIVTTQNFIKQVEKIIPDHWGILLAFECNSLIKFRYLRKSRINKSCEIQSLLLSLWKTELLDILKLKDMKYLTKYNREELVQLVAKKYTNKSEINLEFSKQIAQRQPFWIT